MIKRKLTAAFAALISLSVLSACGGPAPNLAGNHTASDPERIVVLDYAVLDLLELIGFDGEVMTAVSSLPAYLEDSFADSPSAGTLKELDMEAISEFGPDYIFISGRQLDYQDDLNEIAPTLYFEADNSHFLESSLENIRKMAEVFDAEDQIEDTIDGLKTRAEGIRSLAEESRARSLVILTNDGSISAFGSGSRFGYLFDELGLTPADSNIESSTHGQSVSYEYIYEQNPDVIFYVDRTVIAGGSTEASTVLQNELIQNTNAAANGRIYALDPEYIYTSAGGLQSLAATFSELEAALSGE